MTSLAEIWGIVMSTMSIRLSTSTGFVEKLSKEVSVPLFLVSVPRILFARAISPCCSKLVAKILA